MEQKPKVAIITTGGTILSHYDPDTKQVRPAKTGEQLLSELPLLQDQYDIELIQFCNVPGPHLTPQMGLELARQVEEILLRPDISGAVVLQGTDSLEEMAYLSYLLIASSEPVVFSGSMKSTHELYADSLGNLYGAIRLAASKEACGRGVLVYFNQTIFSPRYVVKMKTSTIDAFEAPETGPVGVVTNETIHFFHPPSLPQTHDKPQSLTSNIQLIKVTCGSDDLLLRACIKEQVDGIVIEGFGTGNIPPGLVPALEEAAVYGIPVVMVSRCIEGFAGGTYDYVGGGAQLKKLGVICGQNLGGLRARLKLMVLHSASNDLNDIRRGFGEDPCVID